MCHDRDVPADPEPPLRAPRAEPRQIVELRALRVSHPELADAVDMHLELLELERRIRLRVTLPMLELNEQVIARHQAEARPILRFEDIPLDLTDLRLMVRQTSDVLRRYGALDDADHREVQALGRDMKLLAVVSAWYRTAGHQQEATVLLHLQHLGADGRTPSDLQPLRTSLEVRAADLPVLPQQRSHADHVVRHAGRHVPRLCL